MPSTTAPDARSVPRGAASRKRVWWIRATWVFRSLAFAVASGLFLFAIWILWLAFTTPLELEVREGTVWLHVLAKKAGLDIYDPSQVAFVNMNHGPMDAILKTWLARLFPFLPGWMVTRAFVLLLPACLLGAAYSICRKNLTAALLAAGALQLFLMRLSVLMVVGRSDGTALCGLALAAALVHRLLTCPNREWPRDRFVGQQLLLGAISSVVFLTSWRFIPTLAALHLLVLTKLFADSGFYRVKTLLLSTVLALAGFLLVWVPTFLIELHGDPTLYYQRFFGFFSSTSGWGTFAGAAFHLFPPEVTRDKLGLLLLMAALCAFGLYRLRKERAEAIVWLLLLPSSWVIYAYGFHKNQGGGGPHYFCPFFLLAWLFILRTLRVRKVSGPLKQLVLAGLVAGLTPWPGLLAERQQLTDLRAQTKTFMQNVAARAVGYPVFSEDLHLFKTTYAGELVDTGDTAFAIATSFYFGETFRNTFKEHESRITDTPSKFVLAGLLDKTTRQGVLTPRLTGILKDRYDLVLEGPACLIGDGGWTTALFERKDQP